MEASLENVDDQLLSSFYASRPEQAAAAAALPADLRDRVWIYHRGVDSVERSGDFWLLKLELLWSFFVMQPLWKLLQLLTVGGRPAPSMRLHSVPALSS